MSHLLLKCLPFFAVPLSYEKNCYYVFLSLLSHNHLVSVGLSKTTQALICCSHRQLLLQVLNQTANNLQLKISLFVKKGL